MNLKECYLAIGADYEDIMRRFKSEERVERFLKMFLNDKSFEILRGAIVDEQYEAAFRAVHTMKGICMNLSLTALYRSCVLLTENLRPGSPDGDTRRFFEKVTEDYERTEAAVRDYLGQGV